MLSIDEKLTLQGISEGDLLYGDKVSLFLKAPFSLMLTEITEGYSLNEAAMIIDI